MKYLFATVAVLALTIETPDGRGILRILGPGQTIGVENRDAYWEDRDERDLGPAARGTE